MAILHGNLNVHIHEHVHAGFSSNFLAFHLFKTLDFKEFKTLTFGGIEIFHHIENAKNFHASKLLWKNSST